ATLCLLCGTLCNFLFLTQRFTEATQRHTEIFYTVFIISKNQKISFIDLRLEPELNSGTATTVTPGRDLPNASFQYGQDSPDSPDPHLSVLFIQESFNFGFKFLQMIYY
ncbi:hypothetical protein RZS08_04685, partial [Arthrospira platensis SPKY1]|nr:hypothetical protein [Arthrospira platensis SPKY1]